MRGRGRISAALMSANFVKCTAWASALLLLASIGAQFGTACGQEKSSNSQNPDSASDAQGTIPATKVKVRRGSIDDIDAIGKRKLFKELDWYSETRETELGKRQAQELEQGQSLLVDPQVTDYVNRIAQNLVANSDAKGPITIKVLQSNEVNCTSLPGFLYVTTGLIAAAANEAELAGVIAQGIGHIAARHATRGATRMVMGSVRTHALTASDAVRETKGDSTRYSREFTKEADYLAVQYMYKAGYDPDGFVTFLRKQDREKLRSASDPAYPPTADRIQSALKEIARILPARAHSILNTPEFDSIQSRLRTLER
jgi:beta-barrel assembly-enhancing protease